MTSGSQPDVLRQVDHGVCPKCGHVMFPILPLSPCGHDEDPIISPLTEPGFVYSWTKLATGEEPRTIVMADFLDGRLRVTAQYVGPDVQIGDRIWLRSGEESPYVLIGDE